MHVRAATRVLTILLATGVAIAFAPASHAVQKIYCINGFANNTQWAWDIEATQSTTRCNETNTQAVATTGNEANDEDNLRERFKDSVNDKCGGGASAELAISAVILSPELNAANCPDGWLGFKVTAEKDFEVAVGPAGTADPAGDNSDPDDAGSSADNCTGGADTQGTVLPGSASDGNHCNFNAEVGQGSADQGSATVGLPSLTDWGRIGLVILILAAASALILTRVVRRKDSTA